MSMFYHILQEGEYRFVQCSNASDAILPMENRGTLPFLSAGPARHPLSGEAHSMSSDIPGPVSRPRACFSPKPMRFLNT
ncbi:hypothetical protein GGI64_003306 [Rhizobium leguminosarum]|uniref:Uncharacterized protein n=2 Tax=Rhizobium leguminosarum TaxID=384 RepID=A0A7Z0DZF6_RHILE|nr:hypothetical protein [Rhizobium leguminosarum]